MKIWSLTPSYEFRLDKVLQGHQRWVWDCAFSADSAYLVTGELLTLTYVSHERPLNPSLLQHHQITQRGCGKWPRARLYDSTTGTTKVCPLPCPACRMLNCVGYSGGVLRSARWRWLDFLPRKFCTSCTVRVESPLMRSTRCCVLAYRLPALVYFPMQRSVHLVQHNVPSFQRGYTPGANGRYGARRPMSRGHPLDPGPCPLVPTHRVHCCTADERVVQLRGRQA